MRRLPALLLCVLLAVAMSMPLFAAAPQKVGALDETFGARLEQAASVSDITSLTVYPGDVLRVRLPDDKEGPLFYDQEGAGIPAGDISLSRLRAARIEVEVENRRGSDVIDSVDFAGSGQGLYLEVHFAQHPLELEDTPFDAVLQVTMAGEAQPGGTLRIGGVMLLRQVELTAKNKTVDLRDGAIAVAAEDVPDAVLTVGEGVTITADLQAGERYYAHAETDFAETEIVLTAQTREDAGAMVSIDRGSLLYVYDDGDEYLGTTKGPLPFSPVYRLYPTRQI